MSRPSRHSSKRGGVASSDDVISDLQAHQRHRRKPTLITSNLGFSEWRSFLKNDHLTAALIDRNSHVINMKNCVSIRPKLAEES